MRRSGNLGKLDLRRPLRGALLLLITLFGLPAPAQATLPDPLVARFRRLDSETGLSQDTVMAMVQDRHGWLWLGTQDGLNRFDGYEVVTYRADADAEADLGSSSIITLLIDRRDNLWVGTSYGLFRYLAESDQFEAVTLNPEGDAAHPGFINALYEDAEGGLWVGSDFGLSYRAADASDAERWTTWPLSSDDGTATAVVRAVARDGQGLLWVGTASGLRRFDPAQQRELALPELPFGTQPINALLIDDQRRLWVATDESGVFVLADDGRVLRQINRRSHPVIAHDRSHSLLQSRDRSVWIGGEAGAFRIDPSAELSGELQAYRHRPNDPYSLGIGRVRSLFEDRDGSLWFGTWEGGAARLNARHSRFLSFNGHSAATEAMSDPRVMALAAEGDQLWLGTAGGVFRFDTVNYRLQSIDALSGLGVFSMAVSEDALWIGTGAGLHRWPRGAAKTEAVTPLAELSAARIRRLLLHQDRLWLFAELHGLYVFEYPSLRLLIHHPQSGNINNLAALSAGSVAAVSSSGLHWFDARSGEQLRFIAANLSSEQGAIPGRPSCSLHDEQGRLWVCGYGSGLLRLQLPPEWPQGTAMIQRATHGLGLRNEGVNSALGDALGRLWLATDRGISEYNPDTRTIRNFDAGDGVLDRGYYFSSTAQLADGRLAFGSKHGFTLFDPGEVEQGALPPAPLLTAIERDGVALATSAIDAGSPLQSLPHRLSELVLPAGGGRSLGFRFASPDFVAAADLSYRYRLEGFDSDWVELAPGRRIASYTNIPHGRYRLRLLAAHPSAGASPETVLSLRILPHWWQTLWAQATVLLLSGALLLLAYRGRVRHLRGQQLRLESLVRERTQALSSAKQRAESTLTQLQSAQIELVRAEKLSALGQLVAGVAHEVNTPLGVALTAGSHLGTLVTTLENKFSAGKLGKSDLLSFIADTREGADMIQRNLERAAELVRNFKQVSVDRSSDGRRSFNLRHTLDELTQSLKLLWKPRPIELQVECPDDIELDSFPGALGQVLTNLAQNAVLHAFADLPGGRMKISVRGLDAARIELRFSDDGQGIAGADLGRVFEPFFTTRRHEGGTGLGLHIVHNLVTAKLGGSIAVQSTRGQGTDFILTLPRVAPASADAG